MFPNAIPYCNGDFVNIIFIIPVKELYFGTVLVKSCNLYDVTKPVAVKAPQL